MKTITAAPRAATLALAMILAPTTAGCARLFEQEVANRDRVSDFVTALDQLEGDTRTPMLISYARGVDEMVGSRLPVAGYVDEVQRRQACYWATYGHRGDARETAMLNAVADDDARKARWRDYVVISTDRPAILADEHVCDA